MFRDRGATVQRSAETMRKVLTIRRMPAHAFWEGIAMLEWPNVAKLGTGLCQSSLAHTSHSTHNNAPTRVYAAHTLSYTFCFLSTVG